MERLPPFSYYLNWIPSSPLKRSFMRRDPTSENVWQNSVVDSTVSTQQYRQLDFQTSSSGGVGPPEEWKCRRLHCMNFSLHSPLTGPNFLLCNSEPNLKAVTSTNDVWTNKWTEVTMAGVGGLLKTPILVCLVLLFNWVNKLPCNFFHTYWTKWTNPCHKKKLPLHTVLVNHMNGPLTLHHH